jgi:hypothetical protein
MNSKPYSVLMATIVIVLVGLALWQFYSLIVGDSGSSIGMVSPR